MMTGHLSQWTILWPLFGRDYIGNRSVLVRHLKMAEIFLVCP